MALSGISVYQSIRLVIAVCFPVFLLPLVQSCACFFYMFFLCTCVLTSLFIYRSRKITSSKCMYCEMKPEGKNSGGKAVPYGKKSLVVLESGAGLAGRDGFVPTRRWCKRKGYTRFHFVFASGTDERAKEA